MYYSQTKYYFKCIIHKQNIILTALFTKINNHVNVLFTNKILF
jgi:hypothetical protein